MPIFKCKMCGGDLKIVEGTTVTECEYRCTRQTVPDGNIYGFRSGKGACGSGIVKIDTKTDKVSVLHEDVMFGSYGTKNAINGKIYSLPGYTNDVWEFDPLTQKLKKCYTLRENESVHYAGGAVDVNGDIYAIPVHANTILKISFEKYGINIPNSIYNAFFKDFY